MVAELLDLQPYSVGLCETHPLTTERTLSIIDRRWSDGGIGTCTPLEKESMAAEAGSGDRRHIPTWNGNAAKWESIRDEVRVWRLGENLNVRYSLAARLVFGLSGPSRMTCVTMDADQLHPPPGDGPVGTAHERRNIAGLDNVMNVLQASPLVKKLPARKNELLHTLFPRRLFGKNERRTNRHVFRAIQ